MRHGSMDWIHLAQDWYTNGITSSVSFKSLLTEGSEFESLRGQQFSLIHVVQTGSGAHPTSYPMGTVGSFPGGKAAEA
jgi:hypothetical protein